MVATWKPEKVKELEKEIKNSTVVGLVNIEGMPSNQFQKIRKKLINKAEITVTKNKLIERALEKAGKKDLAGYIDGPTGLILTDLNPFRLNRILEENKGTAPAKKGDKAPYDIIAPKGETPLPAGPVIGELQQAGVKARIDAGKIMIMEDSLIVKEGEVISEQAATVMNRLDIKPMEIGLKLRAACEDGTTYTRDILHIDEAETLGNLKVTYIKAFNLCMNAGIINNAVITPMLLKAQTEALNLAINQEILNKETIKQFISKANMEMLALASRIAGEKKEEKPEPIKEDTPVEEDKKEDDAASAMVSMFD
ncbi:MAG: 50S ribosomal protein L10 [Candidatus Altiarchaeales archaeon ex4484_2]|nr:MAG: 50S ribosomal protein L10 [Candidatus Altiarchaeales archaeon ex4484_2]